MMQESNKIKQSNYKLGLISLKYIPIIMFLIMYIHVGLLLLNVDLPIAETIAGSAIIPSILILSISSMFKFCYLHKSLTLYALAVDLCINFQRYIGFGIAVDFTRVLVFIIGTALLLLLILKINKYRSSCCIIKEDILK